MKRFTETDKWRDVWYRKLPPKAKLLWLYMVDNCDHAGVLEIDWELASFQIGVPVEQSLLVYFERQIHRLKNGKYHIRGFVKYQYGKLSRDCKPHTPVFAALERNGLTEEDIAQNEAYSERVNGYLRDKILERDGLVCAYFNEPIQAQDAVIHHVIPIAKGGQCSPDNLVVASSRANSLKWEYSVEEFCARHNLPTNEVIQRIQERTSKPIEGFLKGTGKGQGRGVRQEEEIYSAYPRKVARPEGLKAIVKALSTVAANNQQPFEYLLSKTRAFSDAVAKWTEDEQKFIPHPATWFNQGRYDDDPTTWTRKNSNDQKQSEFRHAF